MAAPKPDVKVEGIRSEGCGAQVVPTATALQCIGVGLRLAGEGGMDKQGVGLLWDEPGEVGDGRVVGSSTKLATA